MKDSDRLELLNWRGDFSLRDWEAEFKAAQAPAGAARMRFVCLVTSLAYLAAAYPNYQVLGPSAWFFLVLILRLVAFTAGMATFFMASRESFYNALPYAVAGYMAIIGIGEAVELVALAHKLPMEGVPFTVIIVLTYYAFLPMRLKPTAAAAFFTSLLYMIALILGTPATTAYVEITGLMFFLVNAFGIYFMISFGRVQRNEFRALREERQANELLQKEIAQRKEVERRLQELATTDELTGVSNRRRFFEMSQRELNRANRRQSPLCLLMIDADDFKMINDKFGHQAGDLVLQALARACRGELRQEDILGRLGGEEFAACLPDTSLEQAVLAAERIRQAVERIKLETGDGLAGITVSIGVAAKNEARMDLAQLLVLADRALYQAKANGRNRLETAPEEDVPPEAIMLRVS
jgi:diguanylate cyclase (GGDEF)-like protein